MNGIVKTQFMFCIHEPDGLGRDCTLVSVSSKDMMMKDVLEAINKFRSRNSGNISKINNIKYGVGEGIAGSDLFTAFKYTEAQYKEMCRFYKIKFDERA